MTVLGVLVTRENVLQRSIGKDTSLRAADDEESLGDGVYPLGSPTNRQTYNTEEPFVFIPGMAKVQITVGGTVYFLIKGGVLISGVVLYISQCSWDNGMHRKCCPYFEQNNKTCSYYKTTGVTGHVSYNGM